MPGSFRKLSVRLQGLAKILSLRSVQEFHRIEIQNVGRGAVETFRNAREVGARVFNVAFYRGTVHAHGIGEINVFRINGKHRIFRSAEAEAVLIGVGREIPGETGETIVIHAERTLHRVVSNVRKRHGGAFGGNRDRKRFKVCGRNDGALEILAFNEVLRNLR